MSNFKFAVVGDKDLTQIFKVVGMDTFTTFDEIVKDDYALILNTVGTNGAKPLGQGSPLPIIMEVKI